MNITWKELKITNKIQKKRDLGISNRGKAIRSLIEDVCKQTPEAELCWEKEKEYED